jgi:predicted ATP-grasp superfamily ATP-dependent carboligase
VTESKERLLVTDGNERSALAVTRGLGQAGIAVIVGAETKRSLASASRYCVETWRYPSPKDEPAQFISKIKEAISHFGLTGIVAVSDATTQLLAESRDEFSLTISPFIPSFESYSVVSDKFALMQIAQQLDVPIPKTIFVLDGNVEAVADNVKAYPVVVKPGRSLVKLDGVYLKTSVHVVFSRDELIQLYRRTPYLRYPSLVQQRIEGPGQGVFGLFDHGRPCALFAHRRIREKPPSGGVSVLRESIPLSKPMRDYAVSLLEHVKWQGVAMVEFKVDRVTGVPMLMEINGRFWGSLQLALDSGLNFPYLLYQMAKGSHISLPDDSYRIGTRSRWLLGDLDHLILRLRKSRTQLHLDCHAPSRWRCLVDFCRMFQRDLHYEVERLKDPGPAFREYHTWLRNVCHI